MLVMYKCRNAMTKYTFMHNDLSISHKIPPLLRDIGPKDVRTCIKIKITTTQIKVPLKTLPLEVIHQSTPNVSPASCPP